MGATASEKPQRCACHRVEAGGLGVDRDDAGLVRARDPFLQAFQRADGLVFGAVDLGGARGLAARGGKRDGGEGAIRFAFVARFGRGSWRKQVAADRSCRSVVLRRRGRRQLDVCLDRTRIDAGLLGDAAGDGGELHRLQESDEVLVIRLVHRELIDGHVELHIVVQRHQPLGDARKLGIVDQRLAALVLLDLAGALEQRFEIAVFADQLRRGFDADARHARDVVARSRRSAPAPR